MRKPTRQTSRRLSRALTHALGLVLLFSFRAAAVTAPQDARASADPPERALVVTVSARGLVQLDGRAAGTLARPEPLTAALKTALGGGAYAHAEPVVYVKAPGSLTYGEVVKVVDAAKSAGASVIKLVVNDEQLRAELDGYTRRPTRPAGDNVDEGPVPPVPAPLRDPATVKESSIVVAVTSDGQTYLGRKLFAEGELESELKALLGALPDDERVVYLRGEAGASYGRVVEVINLAERAGATAVGLLADRKRHG